MTDETDVRTLPGLTNVQPKALEALGELHLPGRDRFLEQQLAQCVGRERVQTTPHDAEGRGHELGPQRVAHRLAAGRTVTSGQVLQLL